MDTPDLKKNEQGRSWPMWSIAKAEELQAPSSQPDEGIKSFQSCFGQLMLVWLENIAKERNYAIISQHFLQIQIQIQKFCD